ncbi:uncharacterized protein TNCV_4294171 [Trichonephila clavipes]|uniref:Mutator-like transposase domain-containing protein n=1 Tax=Trichonephila clavipes TaxID=2585209 RepID=A0A8X6RKL9_TRICX|nr:uncharacterized protein TNCV_4294171 [Trichonephila clavipes]
MFGTQKIFRRWGLQSFTSIDENKVYGDHCSVEKLECIGHVMKRMGTRLRRLKTKMRGQKLSDGKPLCGRNRLTEAEIDRLQAYYGLAIRRNLSSVKDMQQAIWAIFLHKLSTDEKPQHGFCPSDSDTWCKFKKAELLGETYHHKNSLPVDVVEAMRPVFRDLANPELLKKKNVYMESVTKQNKQVQIMSRQTAYSSSNYPFPKPLQHPFTIFIRRRSLPTHCPCERHSKLPKHSKRTH